MLFVYTLKINSGKATRFVLARSVRIMSKPKRLFASVFCALFVAVGAFSQAPQGETEIVPSKGYKRLAMERSAEVDSLVKASVEKAAAAKGIKPEEVAVSLIDLRGDAGKWGEHRGEDRIYPASVVKMFYLVSLYQQLADGKVKMTKELERGMRDMIVTSSNEATQYIVDVLTNTASGSELPEKEFELWSYRRNRMNRYFAAMGYTNINVNQKTHCEDAYGVEQQFRNYRGENRNMLTANASARLIAEVARGLAVSPEHSKQMLEVLKRDPYATGREANSQAVEFAGRALLDLKIEGAKLWSKAGWTSRTRHDAAYIETPDGLRFAVAVFTENRSNDKDIIPLIVANLIEGMRKK